jgi:hypothetical protein
MATSSTTWKVVVPSPTSGGHTSRPKPYTINPRVLYEVVWLQVRELKLSVYM